MTRTVWALAMAPMAWLTLFAAFVVRARLTLGVWPAPYRPDPKDLRFDGHYYGLLLGLPLMFAAAAGAVALSAYTRRVWAGAAAVASLGALIVLARIDPGGIFLWLGD